MKGGRKEMMKKGMMNEKHWGMHKMMGWKILVLGILTLVNVYWLRYSWPLLIGWILVFMGIAKLIMHCCNKKK